QPERHDLLDARLRRACGPGDDEEEPHADRHQLEYTGEVVGRGMVRPLLVLVIQAIELRDQDPHRERRDEAEVLVAGADLVTGRPLPPAGQAPNDKMVGSKDGHIEGPGPNPVRDARWYLYGMAGAPVRMGGIYPYGGDARRRGRRRYAGATSTSEGRSLS